MPFVCFCSKSSRPAMKQNVSSTDGHRSDQTCRGCDHESHCAASFCSATTRVTVGIGTLIRTNLHSFESAKISVNQRSKVFVSFMGFVVLPLALPLIRAHLWSNSACHLVRIRREERLTTNTRLSRRQDQIRCLPAWSKDSEPCRRS